MKFHTEKNETIFDQDRKLFLESFSGVKTFQTFKDNKNIKCKTNLIRQVSLDGDSYPIGDFDFSKKIIDVNVIIGLEKLNDMGAGIYLTVNETDGKGRKKENITKIRAVFADFDNTPLPKRFDHEPSMVVETSPGKFHVYYLTDDTPIEGFTQLQKAIAFNFGSDPVVHDLPRIMRLPGFYHCKKERFLSKITSYTGLRYSFALLSEMFKPEPKPQFSAPKYEKQSNFDTDSEFKGQYGDSDGSRNHGLTKIIGGMLKNNRDWNYIEQEVWKHNSYSHPPLSENEVRAVLKSMRRYVR